VTYIFACSSWSDKVEKTNYRQNIQVNERVTTQNKKQNKTKQNKETKHHWSKGLTFW